MLMHLETCLIVLPCPTIAVAWADLLMPANDEPRHPALREIFDEAKACLVA